MYACTCIRHFSLLNRRHWKWLVERIWLVLVDLSSLQNFSRHFYTKQGTFENVIIL